MTPHDVTVLIHHHCIMSPWPHGETSAYANSKAWMLAEGILRERSDGTLCTTLRGEAFLQMILSTPLPVMAAIDPRNGQPVEVEAVPA